MRSTRRGTPLTVLLMGAMALAQPQPQPQPQPEPAPLEPADAGAPAPPPAPRPPRPKPDAGAPATDGGTPGRPDAGAPPAPPPPSHASTPAALNDRAHTFFTALLGGEPGPLVAQAELPFYLEDKRITSSEQLKAEWLNQLRSKRTDLLAFKGFEVLTATEMEQRFGKPPSRLSSWPLNAGKTYLVVANVSGRAMVALYHQVGDDWRIAAFHD